MTLGKKIGHNPDEKVCFLEILSSQSRVGTHIWQSFLSVRVLVIFDTFKFLRQWLFKLSEPSR